MRQLIRSTKRITRGYTLLEALTAIFVIGLTTLLLVPIITLRNNNQRVALRAQAATLADEALTALRELDVTSLANQTNGPLRHVLYNAGQWSVIADATDPGNHTAPNVLALANPGGVVTAESGRLQFPEGRYADATFDAKWNVLADSPADWAIGYLVRMGDRNNGYRFRLAATATDLDLSTGGTQNAVLEKIVSGTATILVSGSTTVTTSTWYRVVLTAIGSGLSVTVNGSPLFVTTDATYTTGPAALLGWAGVHAEIDDIQTTTATTQTWNFDSPVTPTLPAAWFRLGINDLPDTTPTTFDDNATLTLAAYPTVSSTTLKQATVTITWTRKGQTNTYTTTGLIGRSGVGL